ncbi:apolipoprotein N-acyltransferase [Nocardioides sp. Y6]|uniref:Apolipoprotein N-acyltransferase n=1 Tax=Nocardioides malaquae TaxID=2773426 RepID=A0ABR9RRV0_9ACTN|nr:apolipoprotein N-acyltransferase [Nocardioides malaquae]
MTGVPRGTSDVSTTRRRQLLSSATCHALAGVAGITTALAFDPFAVPYAAVVGIALWQTIPLRKGARHAVSVGACFGLGFLLVLTWWLAQSFGPAVWFGLAVVQSMWFALLSASVVLLRRLPGHPFWFAVAWAGMEHLRSSWPLGGLPWGRLGVTTVDTALSPLLPALGLTGTGFVLALVAGIASCGGRWALAHAGARRPPRARLAQQVVWLGCAAVTVPLGIALVPTSSPAVAEGTRQPETIRLALVQGGVPGDGRQLAAHHRRVTTNHVEATVDLGHRVEEGLTPAPDLVVWPENSTAVDPFEDAEARAGIVAAVGSIDAPILVGAMVDGPTARHVLNQGVLWEQDGHTGARYTKRHPVPFGEYIPARGLLGRLSPRLERIPRDMLRGNSTSPLQIGDTLVAVAICYDVAYDDVIPAQVREGAQIAVVQTSNASFTGTAQPQQQLTITRARALETGRSIAVSSTNGVTAGIAPDGRVIARAPLRRTTVLTMDLPLHHTLTPAVRWGHLVPGGLLGVLVIGLGAAVVRAVRNSGGTHRPNPDPASEAVGYGVGGDERPDTSGGLALSRAKYSL